MKRKKFIQLSALFSVGLFFSSGLKSCVQYSKNKIKFFVSGANSKMAHLIREKLTDYPISYVRKIDVAIVGAGVSGLTAGYFISKLSEKNYSIFELDNQIGGNSKNGENQFSKYPYGAHYLPIPANENKILIDFLFENGIIKSFKDGLPVYDELSLCHTPDERILIQNYWYEGLIPTKNLDKSEENQIKVFFDFVKKLKNEKGDDGKFVFAIPTFEASKKNKFIELDKISFADYLSQNNYTSPNLLWYLNYCCLDDYGQTMHKISAYAGLHYFASRRGKGNNCDENAVLTWPEGNGHLIEILSRNQKKNIEVNKLIRKIEIKDELVNLIIFDANKEEHFLVEANKVIVATPLFVRKKIIAESNIDLTIENQPWLVANVVVKKFNDKNGYALCWDNIFKESETLGYVFAQHQSIKTIVDNFVFTLYKPLFKDTPKNIRKNYFQKTDIELQQEIINDWCNIYPDFDSQIVSIDCHIWGHGMASPGINYMQNPLKHELTKPIKNKIYFAHTDYSGISIFEEAFWHGHRVANEILS